jgi:transposase InsO family protein
VVKPKCRLSPYGRWLLVSRIIDEGWPPATAAESMGVSRQTAYKWLRRFREEGVAGLEDRSSRPHRIASTPPWVVASITALRRDRRWGPHRIGFELGMARSTVYAVLCRQDLNRLEVIDRVTRQVIRYERDHPGELIHVDVKKLGRIPDGGGWRLTGRGEGYRDTAAHKRRRLGYDCLHLAVDDHSRVLFARFEPDETGDTCARFIADAIDWFADQGVTVQRVMTDNAWGYTHARAFAQALTDRDARHLRIRPRRPQTNGKAERLNRTILEEFAYAQPWFNNQTRQDALTAWVDSYNRRRPHTALDGASPMDVLVNHVHGNNI